MVDDFKIESGVPLPVPYSKYPVAKLGVGDSFAFPYSKRESVVSRCQKYKHTDAGAGTDFTVRRIDRETGRCWRTK